VIRSFADETTRDLFGDINSNAARRIPNSVWRAAHPKLKQLDLVAALDNLKSPPGNDLHALTGDQAWRLEICPAPSAGQPVPISPLRSERRRGRGRRRAKRPMSGTVLLGGLVRCIIRAVRGR
jgi:proteic killer suppression protein